MTRPFITEDEHASSPLTPFRMTVACHAKMASNEALKQMHHWSRWTCTSGSACQPLRTYMHITIKKGTTQLYVLGLGQTHLDAMCTKSLFDNGYMVPSWYACNSQCPSASLTPQVIKHLNDKLEMPCCINSTTVPLLDLPVHGPIGLRNETPILLWLERSGYCQTTSWG